MEGVVSQVYSLEPKCRSKGFVSHVFSLELKCRRGCRYHKFTWNVEGGCIISLQPRTEMVKGAASQVYRLHPITGIYSVNLLEHLIQSVKYFL